MRVYLTVCITKDKKAFHKAVVARDNEINLQFNKIINLEDSMIMYSIYNSETVEKLN